MSDHATPDNAIEVVNLGKKYHIGKQEEAHGGVARQLFRLFSEPLRRVGTLFRYKIPTDVQAELWALSDVSFTVKQGETFGIIGMNGSGKSTILKIISHIVQPTTGSVITRGRISSLLEVGSGFHDELTGRENLFLNATILGMTQQEIREKYDSIVEFAEIEAFMDTPVKRYSSGMRIRLAFSIAAHVQPDIMIVDEVFAVGDAAFREKCLNTIEVLARSGKTVVVVSHSIGYIERLCDRVVWLEKGRVMALGETNEVSLKYTKQQMAKVSSIATNGAIEYPPQPEKAMCARRIEVLNQGGEVSREIEYCEPFQIRIEYDVNEPVENVMALCFIETLNRVIVIGTSDADRQAKRLETRHVGHYSTVIDFPATTLNEGDYQVTLSLSIPYQHVYDRRAQAVGLTIVDTQSDKHSLYNDKPRPGFLGGDFEWNYEQWPMATSSSTDETDAVGESPSP